ncbi:MAG: ExbD/TolR family protein [Sandaracinaceae bacterium]
MAGGTSGDDDEAMISAINVTPLVDVVLVLLIILMVTAQYLVSKSIPMELPQAENADENLTENRQLVVSIDADGQLYLDGEAIDAGPLRREVRSYAQSLQGTGEPPRAIIAADGAVAHRQVVQIIDLLRGESVSRFAIQVNPEDLETEE